MLNIDTPETVNPRLPVQCLGSEASDFLKQRLPAGTVVQLEYDIDRTDYYGRTLASVFENGVLVNAEIALKGLGLPVVFQPNMRFYNEVLTASHEAQLNKTGLFSDTIPCTLLFQFKNMASQTLPQDPKVSVDENLNSKELNLYKNRYQSLLQDIYSAQRKAYVRNHVFKNQGIDRNSAFHDPFDQRSDELDKEYKLKITVFKEAGEKQVREYKLKQEKQRKGQEEQPRHHEQEQPTPEQNQWSQAPQRDEYVESEPTDQVEPSWTPEPQPQPEPQPEPAPEPQPQPAPEPESQN